MFYCIYLSSSLSRLSLFLTLSRNKVVIKHLAFAVLPLYELSIEEGSSNSNYSMDTRVLSCNTVYRRSSVTLQSVLATFQTGF